MGKNQQRLPDSELDIMLILWSHEPPMSRPEIEKIVNEKKKLSPTTILTLLSRLEKKKFVSVEKQGKLNLYTPLISQEEYQRNESKNILEKLYGNSLKKFVVSLYGGKKLDREKIQELSEFIQELEEMRNKMEGYLFHTLKLNAVVSAVILFTVFLGKRLKNKYSAGWKYVIWLLLSLVLLFPVNLFPRGVVTVKIAEEATGDFVESQGGTSGGENESRETAGPLTYVRENVSSREIRLSAERISWRGLLQIFFPLWIAGIVLTGLFRILQYQYSLGRIKRWSVPETDRGIKRMYRTECINKHIRRPPVLLRVENLESPLLAGLFRTALYIPEKGYSAEELRLIFSHELFHYQKKDLWYKLLLMTVSVLYWFNPFLILMRIEAEKDIENLRDRQVICGCQVQERKLYQQLLLKTAALDRNLTPHLAASLNDSFLVFKERIFYMKRAAKLKRGMLPAVLAGFLVLFLNGLVGTSVEAPSAHRPEGIRRALLEEASRDAERAMMEAETPIQAASPDRSGIVPGSGSAAKDRTV